MLALFFFEGGSDFLGGEPPRGFLNQTLFFAPTIGPTVYPCSQM